MTPNEVQMVANEVRMLAGEMRKLGESNARLEERIANHVNHEDERWDQLRPLIEDWKGQLKDGASRMNGHEDRLVIVEDRLNMASKVGKWFLGIITTIGIAWTIFRLRLGG
jgi:hypothetical protein